MPVTLSYPGVYVEELSSGVRTITGVATSITAFIGSAPRGPGEQAVRIQNFADFERTFGGVAASSPMSYAVQHYFQHGGGDAYIVRVLGTEAAAAELTLPTSDAAAPLVLVASSAGTWGGALRVAVSHDTTKDPARLFTLIVQELESPGSSTVIATETIINLSVDATDPRFVGSVLGQESTLVTVKGKVPANRPTATIAKTDDPNDATKYKVPDTAKGNDGKPITDAQIAADDLKAGRKGLYALDTVDLFNLLCIPPLAADTDPDPAATLATAARYCKDRRAVLIVDPPTGWSDTAKAEAGIGALRTAIGNDLSTNAAVYFPRLKMPDPLQQGRSATFAPCGAVAGIIARTDAQRGVWKAPAGLDASFSGVRELSYKLDDNGNGRLNPQSLNCIRSFPVFGNVVWGARTLAGSDALASEWKYLPVRRLALFIEESLYRGTQWAVFEPNDEPLWAQIRLNLGAFMHDLFVQGAFQGQAPRDAYFVKCDKETTPQHAVDKGIVNIVVGFAPLKPAEFVVLKIQQIAGAIQT